jgi:DNA polymerase III subunit delta
MKYQQIKAFKKHLDSAAQCKLAPIYLLIIPDAYERKKAVAYLCAKMECQDPLSYSKFDASEVSVEKIIAALLTPSLFGETPLVVIDNFDSLKKSSSELISKYLEKKHPLVLATKGKVPISTLIEKIGVVLDMSGEKSWEKEKRFTEEILYFFGRENKKITLPAVEALVERCALDFALLEQEMLKLSTYAANLEVIDIKEVKEISVSSPQGSFWSVAEDIVWKDALFKDFLKDNDIDDAFFHGLISALRYQLEIGMLLAATQEVPSQIAHLPPRILENRKELSRLKGEKFFKKGLNYLFEIDLLSKDGVSSFKALLELFRQRLINYTKFSIEEKHEK